MVRKTETYFCDICGKETERNYMSVGVRLPFVHPAAPKYEDQRDRNDKLHKFMLDGINKYLGTAFTEENMELIYTYLGNDCNRPLCREFIRSGYVFDLLYDYAEKGRGVAV